eukprot:1431442-Rhodomonas_salina.3
MRSKSGRTGTGHRVAHAKQERTRVRVGVQHNRTPRSTRIGRLHTVFFIAIVSAPCPPGSSIAYVSTGYRIRGDKQDSLSQPHSGWAG